MSSKALRIVDQPELALSRRPDRVSVPLELVMRQQTFSNAIQLCVQLSGLDDKEVYMTLGIDAGHWSRVMKGDAHFPVNKLPDLMDLCGNEAPLMWFANQRGYGLVLLKSEAERRAEEAESALAREREQNKLLRELIQGRAA